ECLLSVVADLREASPAVTKRIAEILLLLQLHRRTVHSFYAVQPRKRDVQKQLQKVLTPPKRSATPTPFQCVFLREVFELCNYVDRSQLTANLGGYFIYNHESWVSFIKEMDSFVQDFVCVVRKLPVCIRALQDFSRLPVPTKYETLSMFCSTNQARLECLRRDLGLDALLRRCECVLEKFRHPEKDPCYQDMVGTVLFTHTALEMLQNYDRIQAAVEKVDLLWRRVFSSALLSLHVLQLQRDTQQVVCEMEQVIQKMQKFTPENLRDADQAETLRSEFSTSVYTQAKALVRRAEEMLNTVSKMDVFRQRGEEHRWISELERWTDQLRALMVIQSRNLKSICTFHHSYHTVNFPFFIWCTKLRRLLLAPASATFRDLQQVLQWQYECLKNRNQAAGSAFELHPGSNVCVQSVPPDPDVFLKPGANAPPVLQPGVKPPSLSSFDSGFDGAGHLEAVFGKTYQDEPCRTKSPHLHVCEENVSSIALGAPSICIVPNASGEKVNLEITVKRSATLPKNPWLSLPVDDLENCYMVIISPSQKTTRSCDQLTQTTETSLCELQDQTTDWSPIRNVLSSTVTDGGHEAETSENMPTLLWDSYDLRDLGHDLDSMLLGDPECEWEIKEQNELRAVEETLSRAAGILQEEESVLAQEEILDVLLEADNPERLWPSWSKACQFTQMSSSELAEAGVMGLEEDLASLHFGSHDDLSPEGSGVLQSCSDTPSETGSDSLIHLKLGNGGPERTGLLKEIENLKVLEEKIIEENLKIGKLRCCISEERMSPQSLSEDRRRFLEKLEQEKQEVEEMERNLSKDLKKSKLKRSSRSRKIVMCSVMGKASVLKEDEVLLVNCRRSTHEALNYQQPCYEEPSNSVVDDHAPHKSSNPGLSVSSKCSNIAADSSDARLSSQDQQNTDSNAPSMFLPSLMSGGCSVETKEQSQLVSSATDVSNAQSSANGEPKDLSDPPDLSKEKLMHSDPSENFEISERCPEVHQVETLTSEETSPAFDPGGPTPLPRSSPINQTSLASIVGPKPKERKNPLQRRSQVEHHQNNNNNLHTLDHGAGLDTSSEEPLSCECLERSEDHNPEAWCESSIIRTPSPQLELSEPCGAVENEVDRNADDAFTRRVCRSPLRQQFQICAREMSDYQTPVVLDTGSSLVKAGFSDQDLPTSIFPAAIGLPKYEEVMSGRVDRGVYVGHDAQRMRGVLTLHYPMRNGAVSNWDQMEMIWTHAFEQLRVCSEDHPVLLTEGVMTTQENRQRSIQLLFECFNVPLAYVAMQPVLALYTSGRTTGVVFDSGDGVSHSVPVFDGYCLPHAVQRFNLSGRDVTLHLQQLLTEQGVCMRTSAEMEIVREMKERCCCVALNDEVELSGGGGAYSPVPYTLPDGQVVSLATERFRAPEILFRPELIGQDYYGMHESVFKSVLRSDVDLRRELVENIILSGGNTLLSGLPERLQQEISRLAPAGLGEKVKVTSPPDRDFSVWRGGAILASMPTFSSAWISQDEYEEFGPQIVFRKCF
ncbi:actin-like, partial [Silurus asotus]